MGMYGVKKKNITDYIDRTISSTSDRQDSLCKCEMDMTSRKAHINDLIRFIFPICEVQARRFV